jgi:hypothetical protein
MVFYIPLFCSATPTVNLLKYGTTIIKMLSQYYHISVIIIQQYMNKNSQMEVHDHSCTLNDSPLQKCKVIFKLP